MVGNAARKAWVDLEHRRPAIMDAALDVDGPNLSAEVQACEVDERRIVYRPAAVDDASTHDHSFTRTIESGRPAKSQSTSMVNSGPDRHPATGSAT